VFTFTSSKPQRFKRSSLLIVGCGDVGLRVARRLQRRHRLLALTSRPERAAELRAAGVVPLHGDLDRPESLRRLAGLADSVLHLAPPAAHGDSDARTAQLLAALGRRGGTRRIVYASSSGVYGDCGGALIDETRTPRPATERSRRRLDAERRLRWHGRAFGVRVSVLRIPGIYAPDRPGGDPRERIARGAPTLVAADDVYTNHIHADDLARACIAALHRGAPQRIYHASDDDASKTGDWLDRVADRCGLARAPRIRRAEAQATLSSTRLSFLGESRRLANVRLERELRLRLRYPTVDAAFGAR
jgi:nucleoside-diphosphate-sugar epimerase